MTLCDFFFQEKGIQEKDVEVIIQVRGDCMPFSLRTGTCTLERDLEDITKKQASRRGIQTLPYV